MKARRGLWLTVAVALMMAPSLALAGPDRASQAGLLGLVVVGMVLALIVG